jgi:hypothetical protein
MAINNLKKLSFAILIVSLGCLAMYFLTRRDPNKDIVEMALTCHIQKLIQYTEVVSDEFPNVKARPFHKYIFYVSQQYQWWRAGRISDDIIDVVQSKFDSDTVLVKNYFGSNIKEEDLYLQKQVSFVEIIEVVDIERVGKAQVNVRLSFENGWEIIELICEDGTCRLQKIRLGGIH